MKLLKERSLYRRRRVNQGPQGIEVDIDGQRLVNFCSNDYLGLANHPAVVEAFKLGAQRYGVGSGSAHLISGHSIAHQALEEELAEFTGFARVLLFSTGYMANLGVISALLGKGDRVFEDRLNHASLLDGGLLSGARFKRYPHRDVSALAELLSQGQYAKQLVVTDGVFSMDGDLADLPGLSQLCASWDAGLLVDDAHGIGVLGQNGRGVLEHFALKPDAVSILVGTLGKAFGTFGAFVAGSEQVIEYLIQRARTYIYTTAIPPALAEATRASLRLAREENWRREKLGLLVARFRRGALGHNLPILESPAPIQPLLLGDNRRAIDIAHRLRRKGILVMPIRPPAVPAGSARLRVTFSALHDETHVDRLVEELSDAWTDS
ncbi:MAG: 8-amino-7-oxononanoate synthase [Methylococcaceae bacterium]|nr:8-amino-7-oxononanoate synthase [Methylococcaceae bacterium]